MLGSDALLKAAQDDGNDWAYYGVATHYNTKDGCGRCHQISYLPHCGEYWNSTTDEEKKGTYYIACSTEKKCCFNGECGDGCKDFKAHCAEIGGKLCNEKKCCLKKDVDCSQCDDSIVEDTKCYCKEQKGKYCDTLRTSVADGCYQSQTGKCCLDGACDNCKDWYGYDNEDPDFKGEENVTKDDCDRYRTNYTAKHPTAEGTYCEGWCTSWSDKTKDAPVCTKYPQKPLIVQSFNTAITCMPPESEESGQFDIYLGYGGFGANNGCSSPGTKPNSQETTYGGNFYGGEYQNWPDIKDGKLQGGGASRFDQCDKLSMIQGFRIKDEDWKEAPGQKNYGKAMIDACKFALGNDPIAPTNPYHGNWAIRYKEVECPEGLTKLTGMRLKYPERPYNWDGTAILPKPSEGLVKSTGKTGSKQDGSPGWTTSMMDCCKPSCAFDDMLKAIPCTDNDVDPLYSSIYACDRNAHPIYLEPQYVDQLYIKDASGKNRCYDDARLSDTLCKGKMLDTQNGCTSDADCCSNICLKNATWSMCCPPFHHPGQVGNDPDLQCVPDP